VKAFFSCLDMGCADVVPQAMQHLVANDYAGKQGGKVSFYTAEDFLTLPEQSVMRAKLKERPAVDGIIFFRFKQFCYGARMNYAFMQEILDAGYELHFARERLPITSMAELDRQFPVLFGAAYSLTDGLKQTLLDAASRGRR
jgi:hypothetical protein